MTETKHNLATLALVAAATTRPPVEELRKIELEDRYPRATLFSEVLNADLLDATFVRHVGGIRGMLYRHIPMSMAQILEGYILRHRYDAVICWAEHLGLPFALLLKLTGSRVPHVAIWSWISKRKKAELLKRVHSHIDRIVLMSSVQYRFAIEELKIAPDKVVLLKWPIDQKFWRPMQTEADMICTAGREMRDFRTLIQALKETPIPCHIAASYVQGKKDAWQRDIEDAQPLPPHLTIGQKSYHELRELYARSRFVVVPLLPTDTDNGTTTILEAMAMAKPVICTRVRGQADVIKDGRNGILVPPRDPLALREAILHLWEHPELAAAMGKDARTYIEQEHALDAWVATIRTIVEEAIQEHREGNPSHDHSSQSVRAHAARSSVSS